MQQKLLIDEILAPYTGKVPGASLLVLRDDKPLIQCGYGYANLEEGASVLPSTNFRLASISKQFTAAAVLLLVQDGKLSLEDSVRIWLPSLPVELGSVSILHLLTHTSGLLDYEDLMENSYEGQMSDSSVLSLLESHPRLYFPAGTSYRYSNSAYCLLSLVIERASSLSFPDFLRTRLFEPLGMHNTQAYLASSGLQIKERAYGYSPLAAPAPTLQPSNPNASPDPNTSPNPNNPNNPNPNNNDQQKNWTRTDQNSTSSTLGDGGIYSNCQDLALWLHSLSTARLLTPHSLALAFHPYVPISGEPYEGSYGLGWRLTGPTTWHSGESIGFRNVLVRWPGQRLAVVLLTNRNEPEPYQLALTIGQLFLLDSAS